ncbi:GNAT family N-acetyltransferase [Weissella coleopterorum]|uniref:GNAT family N-acetyltransferase n=1 Tax=Weissella coleopterorum TaxID=2714949 RepID=A0A6G8AZF9_9LACO|nr:GNAT family N-acetyltransferase [Weissella coleopterorum]QIL50349.1 GNAT family N-acetyltransferase [Weissella coleopterorum]
MELYIRGAEPSDAPAIIKLLRQLQAESTTFEVVENLDTLIPEQLSMSLAEIQISTDALILVVVNEQNDFYGILTALPNSTALHQTEIGVAILQKIQGMGLGQALMENLLDWFVEYSSSQQLFLTVQIQNKRARHLYEKMNFKYIERSNQKTMHAQGVLVETIDMILEEKDL